MTLLSFMPVVHFRLGVIVMVVVGVMFLAGTLCRRANCSFGGMILRILGIAAVVAGVAVLWNRSESRVESPVVNVNTPDDFDFDFDFDESFHQGEVFARPVTHGKVEAHPHWMLISLGTVLIILGALLFGRERTRPGR